MQLPSLSIHLLNVCQRVLVVTLARVLPFHKEISLSVKPSAFPSYCAPSVIVHLVLKSVCNIHTYTADQLPVFSAPLLLPSTFILPLQYHRITLLNLAASLHQLLKEVTGLPLTPRSQLAIQPCVRLERFDNAQYHSIYASSIISYQTIYNDFVCRLCCRILPSWR